MVMLKEVSIKNVKYVVRKDKIEKKKKISGRNLQKDAF